MPAVLVVLAMSIFPLLLSLYLSLSRFKFVRGGFDISFVGFLNYRKLLFGSQQFHFLGTFGEMSPVAWLVVGLAGLGLAPLLASYVRSAAFSYTGFVWRVLAAVVTWAGVLLISEDLDELLELSDRLAVLHAGHIAGVVDPHTADRYEIGKLMLEGQRPAYEGAA